MTDLGITRTKAFQQNLQPLLDRGGGYVKTDGDKLKVGYNSLNGKIKYLRLSDKPRQYRDGTPRPSERAEEALNTRVWVTQHLGSAAVSAQQAKINEALGTVFNDNQLEKITSSRAKIKEEVNFAVSTFLYQGGEKGQLKGIKRITVADVKQAAKIAEDVIDASVAKLRREIWKGGEPAKDGAQPKAFLGQARTEALIKPGVDDAKNYARLNFGMALMDRDETLFDRLVDPKVKGEFDKAIAIFQEQVGDKVAELLSASAKNGAPGLSLQKESYALVDQMIMEKFAAPVVSAPPKMSADQVASTAESKSEAAGNALRNKISTGKVGYAKSVAIPKAVDQLRSEVRQLATNILLSDKSGDLDAAVNAAVDRAAADFAARFPR